MLCLTKINYVLFLLYQKYWCIELQKTRWNLDPCVLPSLVIMINWYQWVWLLYSVIWKSTAANFLFCHEDNDFTVSSTWLWGNYETIDIQFDIWSKMIFSKDLDKYPSQNIYKVKHTHIFMFFLIAACLFWSNHIFWADTFLCESWLKEIGIYPIWKTCAICLLNLVWLTSTLIT